MVIDNVAKHMPADGSVLGYKYAKYHNAFNGGEKIEFISLQYTRL